MFRRFGSGRTKSKPISKRDASNSMETGVTSLGRSRAGGADFCYDVAYTVRDDPIA
jgi:hypothetical protein